MPSISQISDKTLEQQVLATMMAAGQGVVRDTREAVGEDCFYITFHKKVWQAICSLNDKGEVADLVNVRAELVENNVPFELSDLVELSANLLSLTELPYKIFLINDMLKRRKACMLAKQLENSAFAGGDDFEIRLNELKTLAEDIENSSVRADATSLADTCKELKAHVDSLINGKSKAGILTGFSELDSKGGFLLGDLIIISAKSSVGKTSFALTLAQNMASQGYPGVIYSMEMGRVKLAARIASSKSDLNSNTILSRPLSSEELQRFDRAVGDIYNLPIYFDDKNRSSVTSITNSIRKLHVKSNVQWAIVDYLQILPVNQIRNRSEESMLGEIARELKNVAEELQIPVIALSQLSRDAEDKPRKDRMRGSGQMEEAADTVMLLYRPKLNERSAKKYDYPYENVDIEKTCLVQVAKGRNCGTFDFMVGFDEEHTKFYQLTELPRTTTLTATDNGNKRDDLPF